MKRVFAIILIVITATLIWFFGKMLPDILTNLGKKAYEHKNYVEAYNDLKTAVQLSPKNMDARYYLVETMLNFKPTLEIQRKIYELSQVDVSDSADLITDRQIATWRNAIFVSAGDNYIEQAPFNDKILRWDVKKFPLKVFISNKSSNSVPQYYEQEIKKAFIQWQSSTNGFVRFAFVDSEQDANILVTINPLPDSKKCTQPNCKYVVAYTTPSFSNDLLKKMDIFFYDSNNLSKPFTQREIYNTALHEIGHSLGIMGHSQNKYDLMYMESNEDKISDQLVSDVQLISPRDLNTLVLLYKLIPDITNTPLNEFDTSHQFFAPIVLGNEKQINSRKMVEAQNYINGAPDLPNGYIDLASAYADVHQYNNAIESLNKALTLCSGDSDKFVVYYNFAIIYMQIKDWQNALKYAQLAKNEQPSADIDGLIGMINYNLGNKELAKKSYAEALQKNPANTLDSLNLAIIYLKEFNPILAGQVLNNLVKANPQAANDPKVKSFWLLMFLFK